MKLMTTILVLAVGEGLAPQEVDSLELWSRPQAPMGVMSDQMAGYSLPVKAFGYSLASSLVA